MTGNDVTRPHVTGNDPEVTSFDRMSLGCVCKRPISQVLGTFELFRAVTRGRWQSHDRKYRHATSRYRKRCHLTGNHLVVPVEAR